MSLVKTLGTHGSRSQYGLTTSLLITRRTIIDAGNIMEFLGKDAMEVDTIFFTHAHLDHIVDTAFIIENFFEARTVPLRLFALPQTLLTLQNHLFNNRVWPDFSRIPLPKNPSAFAIEYIPIGYHQRYEVDEGFVLTPIPANHTVDSCGYLIEHDGGGLLFSGDTYANSAIWELLNANHAIKALIIDVSFPNRLGGLARESRHLTPALLAEELKQLQRNDLRIYPSHLKPYYYDEIIEELGEIGIPAEAVLEDGDSIDLVNGSLRRIAASTLPIHEKIEKLVRIGTALSSVENIDALLEMIVTEARSLTNADGGTLYLLDKEQLRFKVVQTDSLGIRMGGESGEITWPPLPLYLDNHLPNREMVAVMCALEEKLINIPDVYECDGFSFEGTRQFDATTRYRSKSMLVIPLKDHEHQIIGVLQLLNKTDPKTHETIPFGDEDEAITRSFASQAAIAITNRMLIQGLENLLEAFLRSIIFAIGKKSLYTAGHISRMVHLSVMIAEAINQDTNRFQGKRFSPEELRQINIAALMHDIGKLAIPEQVVDKSTKLETLFDRISLVESRAETIKKALDNKYLSQKLEALEAGRPIDTAALESELADRHNQLDRYLDVIRRSNAGTEFISDENVALIHAIASEPWVIDGVSYPLLAPDEAYNLSVQKGTLTNEEREIINTHAQISLDILTKLPFPRKYQEIPQISGNHHEKINGKGYPRGLKGDEISFEARILAIADIFEALTASDRPYKKGNRVSVAMKILHAMAKEGELDGELVKFFYDSKLYLANSSLKCNR